MLSRRKFLPVSLVVVLIHCNGLLTVVTGRIGNEKDIGSVILWLCSRAGTYVNGQVVNVDGGEY